MFNKDNHILSVLGGVLGAGMSSRLFSKLREEMGVAYYVNAYNNPSLDHGSFQISAGVNNARLEEVLKEILKECTRLKNEFVLPKELDKVKSLIVGNSKLSLESTDDIANFYGSQEVLKKEMKTIEEKAKKINSVTKEQVKNMARKIFIDKNINIAIIGPVKDENRVTKILSF
jgi:predicted Zn-dependent peptidase